MARLISDQVGAVFVSPSAPSLAQVIERVRGHADLSPTRRRDLVSGVRRVARIVGGGRGPEDILADVAWLRQRIAGVAPAAHGLSPKTWANLVSGLNRALAIAGVTRRPYVIELTGAWAELWQGVKATGDKGLRTSLSRFLRCCQRLGLEPETVTSDAVIRYRDAIAAAETRKDPDHVAYLAAWGWNRAIERVPGWPRARLEPPNRSRAYALAWGAFPASLEHDVDAWLSAAGVDDIFAEVGPARAISASTRKARKGSIQRFASALVHVGVDASELVDLQALVRMDRVRCGLNWLLSRMGGEPTGGLANIAIALKHAARGHVKAEQDHLDRLSAIVGRLDDRQRGMTEKNRARMEPFKDATTVTALLRLPARLLHEAARAPSASRWAVRVETALAIALLTYCPIRLGNLCGIELDRHICRHHRAKQVRAVLQFPGHEVKNKRDLSFELPEALVEMIDLFIARHRPVLLQAPSRFLFSKRTEDAPLHANALRRRMVEAIRNHLGLELTPHNFRHLAGLIYLQANPGAYETVRRLLAHATSSTATDCYIGLETDAAHRAYVELLDGLRGLPS